MDTIRLKSYLNAVCAGLGFDVGEVWWAKLAAEDKDYGNEHLVQKKKGCCDAMDCSNDEGFDTSFNKRSEKKLKSCDENSLDDGSIRFDQLFTSRSYDQSKLLTDSDDVSQHVLSPKLIQKIRNSCAEVVWANCQHEFGLLGRSDVRFQTAVGMPVSIDSNGNMCVVVLFSRNDMASNEDAMEYLYFMRQCALNASPKSSLLLPSCSPSLEENDLGEQNTKKKNENLWVQLREQCQSSNCVKEVGFTILSSCSDNNNVDIPGIAINLLNFDRGAYSKFEYNTDKKGTSNLNMGFNYSNTGNIRSAPIDTFGIPMLPKHSHIARDGIVQDDCYNEFDFIDIIDESSYGSVYRCEPSSPPLPVVTGVVVNNEGETQKSNYSQQQSVNRRHVEQKHVSSTKARVSLNFSEKNVSLLDKSHSLNHLLISSHIEEMEPPLDVVIMPKVKRERLAEFAKAFLGMSSFDIADLWMPGPGEVLQNVFSLTDNEKDVMCDQFVKGSESSIVHCWSGAVGRAFSTGNPVWSNNEEMIVDSERTDLFLTLGVKSVIAIPVYASGRSRPICVMSFYSNKSLSIVSNVLSFVQRGLRLVWDGLSPSPKEMFVNHHNFKDICSSSSAESTFHGGQSKKKRKLDFDEPIPSTAVTRAEVVDASCHVEEESIVGIKIDPLLPSSSDNNSSLVDFCSQILSSSADQNAVTKSSSLGGISTLTSRLFGDNLPALCTPVLSGITSVDTAPVATSTRDTSHIAPSQVESNTNSMPVEIDCEQEVQVEKEPQEQEISVEIIEQPVKAVEHVLSIPAIPTILPTHRFCIPIAPVSQPQISSSAQISTKNCRIQGCDNPIHARKPYCLKHCGNRICEHLAGCTKFAQGSTRFCIAHGGGRRCTFPGCDKGARDKFFCAAHGGGKRCKVEGCGKSAVGGSDRCTGHGGGRRCAVEDCTKSAQASTKYCVKHGGGKKCSVAGCPKVARGKTSFCASHGGGVRCNVDDCNRVAVGKRQLCRMHNSQFLHNSK